MESTTIVSVVGTMVSTGDGSIKVVSVSVGISLVGVEAHPLRNRTMMADKNKFFILCCIDFLDVCANKYHKKSKANTNTLK